MLQQRCLRKLGARLHRQRYGALAKLFNQDLCITAAAEVRCEGRTVQAGFVHYCGGKFGSRADEIEGENVQGVLS